MFYIALVQGTGRERFSISTGSSPERKIPKKKQAQLVRDQRKDRFSLSHFAGTQGKSRGFDIGFEQALLCLVQMIAFCLLLFFLKTLLA